MDPWQSLFYAAEGLASGPQACKANASLSEPPSKFSACMFSSKPHMVLVWCLWMRYAVINSIHSLLFKNYDYILIYLVWMCKWVCVWRSEDNLQESLLFFSSCGPQASNSIFGLGHIHISHLTGLSLFLLSISFPTTSPVPFTFEQTMLNLLLFLRQI